MGKKRCQLEDFFWYRSHIKGTRNSYWLSWDILMGLDPEKYHSGKWVKGFLEVKFFTHLSVALKGYTIFFFRTICIQPSIFRCDNASFRVSLEGYTISSQQFLPAWDVVSTIFARIMLRTSSKSNGAEGNNDLTEEPWNPGCFCWRCFILLVASIQLNFIDIPEGIQFLFCHNDWGLKSLPKRTIFRFQYKARRRWARIHRDLSN